MQTVLSTVMENLLAQAQAHATAEPAQGLALVQIAQSADDLKKARKKLSRTIRNARQAAQARSAHENTHGRCGLEERLTQNPVQALAAAEATPQGRAHLCEIWASLGQVLLEKEGLNEHELKLACILLGAPNLNLRTSSARLDFERAMTQDRERKFKLVDEEVQGYMKLYLSRIGDDTMLAYTEQEDEQAAMFEVFLCHREYIENFIHNHMDENAEFYKQWKKRPPTGRMYWPSTRKFIAEILKKYRAKDQAQNNTTETSTSRKTIHLNAEEMKSIEIARKSVNDAMTNYQKAMAAAKLTGLFTPAKPEKKAPATNPAEFTFDS